GTGLRLGQAVTRKLLHRAKTWQQPLALRLAAEGVNHPAHHVMDRQIGGGRSAALGQFLEDDGCIEPAQARSPDIAPDVSAPEAERCCFAKGLYGKISQPRPSRGRKASFRHQQSRAPLPGRRAAPRKARSPYASPRGLDPKAGRNEESGPRMMLEPDGP